MELSNLILALTLLMHQQIFGTIFLLEKKKQTMEKQQENSREKRRRKIITGPVLVRSAKPGGVVSAEYTRTNHVNPFWKAA